jgi:hypothetical protein
MRQTLAFALICAGILVLMIVGLGFLFLSGALGLQLQGYIALVLGAVLTMALAMLLMGLVFLSNRSGHDRTVYFDRDER